ncbi:MAG: [Fe-Fe] hydrogenase large subunit C-terminal domain-containing protein [Candidatus Micrarchaeia archaeon]
MPDDIYLNNPEKLFEALEKELGNPDKTTVVQIAPAVRVAIGEEFGYSPGKDLTGKTVGLLRQLGFDHVIDTPLGADVNIYEEAYEILHALEREDDNYFPVFNSCCIGWRLYCSRTHEKICRHISPIASPHMISGSIAKHYLEKKLQKSKEDIVSVSIMPCTLKKYETMERLPDGTGYVDYVLTTQELADFAKRKSLDLKAVPEEKFSELLPGSSKDGIVFGVTGGLAEALLTTLAYILDVEKKDEHYFRRDDSIKKRKVSLGSYTLDVVSVHGFANLEKVLKEIEAGERYHFVEVMNCPYGCVGGPGQPLPPTEEKLRARAAGLRRAADSKEVFAKVPQENPTVQTLYRELLDRPGSETARRLLYFQKVKLK